MNKNGELIKRIYEDSSMGYNNLESLLNSLEGKSNKIINLVEQCRDKYKAFQEKTLSILEQYGIEVRQAKEIVKLGSSTGVHMEMRKDNSDSHIADMLIQGFTMGEISMIKGINLYKDSVDKKELKMAEEFKSWQKEMVEKLKKFL